MKKSEFYALNVIRLLPLKERELLGKKKGKGANRDLSKVKDGRPAKTDQA